MTEATARQPHHGVLPQGRGGTPDYHTRDHSLLQMTKVPFSDLSLWVRFQALPGRQRVLIGVALGGVSLMALTVEEVTKPPPQDTPTDALRKDSDAHIWGWRREPPSSGGRN